MIKTHLTFVPSPLSIARQKSVRPIIVRPGCVARIDAPPTSTPPTSTPPTSTPPTDGPPSSASLTTASPTNTLPTSSPPSATAFENALTDSARSTRETDTAARSLACVTLSPESPILDRSPAGSSSSPSKPSAARSTSRKPRRSSQPQSTPPHATQSRSNSTSKNTSESDSDSKCRNDSSATVDPTVTSAVTPALKPPHPQLSITEADALSLSPTQRTAIEKMLTGCSLAVAADAAGVTRITLYRWLNHDAKFQAAYNAWQQDALINARTEMLALADTAVTTVGHALQHDSRLAFTFLRSLGTLDRPTPGPTDPAEVKQRMTLDKNRAQAKLDEDLLSASFTARPTARQLIKASKATKKEAK